LETGSQGGGSLGGGNGRRSARDGRHGGILRVGFLLEPEQDRADRQLIARLESGFLQQSPIDSHTVATAQVTNQHTVVGDGDATMPSRDLRRVDANVALEMPPDEQDGPIESDQGGRSLD